MSLLNNLYSSREMCGVEYLSKRSSTCHYAQTAQPHIWQLLTYTLCPDGVAKKGPCNDIQPEGGQMETDFASARMVDCVICTMLAEAETSCIEAKRIADETFSRAWTAAHEYKEVRNVSSRRLCVMYLLTIVRSTLILPHQIIAEAETIERNAVAIIKSLTDTVGIVGRLGVMIVIDIVIVKRIRSCCAFENGRLRLVLRDVLP